MFDCSNHPIPPEVFEACERLGKLLAQTDENMPPPQWVQSLFQRALREGYGGDHNGLRCRIAWKLRDDADQWHRQRRRTGWDIADALEPLLEVRAEATALLRESAAVNDGAACPFLPGEVVEIVLAEVRRFLQWGGRRRA